MSADVITRLSDRFDVASAQRTLRAWLACALGVLPLVEMFTDRMWLVGVWVSMLVVVAPAAVLRLWWHPRALHTWIGLALLVPWLTARYVPDHAFAGVLPTRGTWHDVAALFDDLGNTTANDVAPVHTTTAIVFTVSLVLALLAALVDLLAVVARHGALAGVPLLVVYTVGGAVPRHPVHWLLFVAAAGGFLLLLSLDAGDEIRSWGRLMPRPGETRPAAALAVSGQRIAVIAIAVAVFVPLLAPSRPTNLIANAFHHGGGSGTGGAPGFGAGGVSIDPFAALKGELSRPKPIKLFTVALDPPTADNAFYLRTNVLATITDNGWAPSDHGPTEALGNTAYAVSPDDQIFVATDSFTASIEIAGLGGNLPIFGRPAFVGGAPRGTRWSPQDELLLGSKVHRGDTYQESVIQPHPTAEQLAAVPSDAPGELAPFLNVPSSMPGTVRRLVLQLTSDATSAYARARAISDYFTEPKNGFTYSLQTAPGDSGNALVDFLTHKIGFCQQYAAAMGIMLRLAGVPARVVLGYTHGAPDKSGSFTVTTDDAHAWVEAYFGGLGWVPFDPTPNAGVFGGAKASLPWAPHPQATASQQPSGVTTGSKSATGKQAGITGPEGPLANTGSGSASSNPGPLLWSLAVVAVLGLVGLVPAVVRWRRRRHRLRASRTGDPDPLWAELSDTAVDLGYVWSPARTPRQVVGWLSTQTGAPGESLRALATAVEQARYAPPPDADSELAGRAGGGALVTELRRVEAQLRSRRRRAVRVRARLFPDSLGWKLLSSLVRLRRR